jgi:hypothetical protein
MKSRHENSNCIVCLLLSNVRSEKNDNYVYNISPRLNHHALPVMKRFKRPS